VNRDAGDPREWEAVELKSRKPSGVMISVRVAPNLAEQVDSIARSNGLSMSEAVRMALDNFVHSGLIGNISYGITGTTSFDVPLRLMGPTVQIRAETMSQATQQEFAFTR
jgi:hypothetical protein